MDADPLKRRVWPVPFGGLAQHHCGQDKRLDVQASTTGRHAGRQCKADETQILNAEMLC
jgi:hypothetical protein